MAGIGVQTKNVIEDENPAEGFRLLKKKGFTDVDFSLNGYLKNTDLYRDKLNTFFDQSTAGLEAFFAPHKRAAAEAGIRISQMHMPYPAYLPAGKQEVNAYLWKEMAPKSMEVCRYLECPYIVVHGFKLAKYLGSEAAEWEKMEEFLEYLAPMAKEYGITMCIENLYDGLGGHLIEGPCCDADKAAERIDRMNGKYGAEVLGFCFDTGHANLTGLDFEKFLRKLGPRLKVLHIHDNDGIRDLHQIPFTFTRSRENRPSTDWEGFVRGLREAGYRGTLSFETAPVLTSFPEELKEDVLGMIVRIGQYFAGEIRKGAE